jgi:hypothetical protein
LLRATVGATIDTWPPAVKGTAGSVATAALQLNQGPLGRRNDRITRAVTAMHNDGELGPHAEAVQEVVAFARGPQVLGGSGVGYIEGRRYVINSLERAAEIAGLEAPDGRPDSSSGEWYNWLGNFRRFRTSEVASRYSRTVSARFDGTYESLLGRLESAGYPRTGDAGLIAEWAEDDLRFVALHRACFGLVVGSLWEDLYDIYRAGLFPCGWQGPWGDTWPLPGRFICWRRAA